MLMFCALRSVMVCHLAVNAVGLSGRRLARSVLRSGSQALPQPLRAQPRFPQVLQQELPGGLCLHASLVSLPCLYEVLA